MCFHKWEVLMDIYAFLDQIQHIARNGLNYAQNPYDRERYEKLMALTAESYTDLLNQPAEKIREMFAAEAGHITPKVGADAAIFNEKGEILLMERVDGSGWCLPCGWVEAQERPCDTAVREVWEETGLQVRIKQLVGVFTRMPSQKFGPHTMIAVVHLCEVLGGELTLSHEGLDLRYWPIDEMTNWHGIHEKYARAAYEMWKAKGVLAAVSD
jgi:ADP-ribose pyrophosphatase YjhB (NUDIX family)